MPTPSKNTIHSEEDIQPGDESSVRFRNGVREEAVAKAGRSRREKESDEE